MVRALIDLLRVCRHVPVSKHFCLGHFSDEIDKLWFFDASRAIRVELIEPTCELREVVFTFAVHVLHN